MFVKINNYFDHQNNKNFGGHQYLAVGIILSEAETVPYFHLAALLDRHYSLNRLHLPWYNFKKKKQSNNYYYYYTFLLNIK